MTEIIFEEENIYQRAEKLVVKSINKILSQKDEVVIGLPGGRNISQIIEILKKERLSWEKIHVFMVDERLVPITDNESNFKLIRGLAEVLPEDNLHPFILEENKADFGLSSYENEIKRHGGAYDIIVVSAGEDGHIAALYPNHPSILNESKFYMLLHDSPKPPKDRMSMTKKMLMRSKVGIILFCSDIKKEAYRKFLDNNIDFVNCPAKLVSKLPESYVLTNIVRGI